MNRLPSTVQALCHALLPNAASASGSSSDAGKWYLNTSALFLWLAVFVLQPHKEERFLYPVYPLVALAAACAVDALQKIYFRFAFAGSSFLARLLPVESF